MEFWGLEPLGFGDPETSRKSRGGELGVWGLALGYRV